MAAKHTPGPWKIRRLDTKRGNDYRVEYASGRAVSHIAEINWWALAEEHGDTLANARLIAAAPALLEALQEVIGNLEEGGADHNPDTGEVYADIAKAREAIAQATGQSE